MFYMGNLEKLPNKEQMAYLEHIPTEELNRFIFSRKFSECLISQRKKLGLTQEQLSKLSGVNRVTITRLENFQRLASMDVVIKLLDVLNLEIQFVERTHTIGEAENEAGKI